MRKKTDPPFHGYQRTSSSQPTGLSVKAENPRRSVKERCALDDRSHRTPSGPIRTPSGPERPEMPGQPGRGGETRRREESGRAGIRVGCAESEENGSKNGSSVCSNGRRPCSRRPPVCHGRQTRVEPEGVPPRSGRAARPGAAPRSIPPRPLPPAPCAAHGSWRQRRSPRITFNGRIGSRSEAALIRRSRATNL
jgi:hypothetical protein